MKCDQCVPTLQLTLLKTTTTTTTKKTENWKCDFDLPTYHLVESVLLREKKCGSRKGAGDGKREGYFLESE